MLESIKELSGRASDTTHPAAAAAAADDVTMSSLTLHECDLVLSVVPAVH